mgnify:CR=1 FL=1
MARSLRLVVGAFGVVGALLLALDPGGRVTQFAMAAGIVPTEVEQPGTQPGEVGNLETPDECDNCHGGDNRATEPAFNWGGSTMANAGQDPLFWATLAFAKQGFKGAHPHVPDVPRARDHRGRREQRCYSDAHRPAAARHDGWQHLWAGRDPLPEPAGPAAARRRPDRHPDRRDHRGQGACASAAAACREPAVTATVMRCC